MRPSAPREFELRLHPAASNRLHTEMRLGGFKSIDQLVDHRLETASDHLEDLDTNGYVWRPPAKVGRVYSLSLFNLDRFLAASAWIFHDPQIKVAAACVADRAAPPGFDNLELPPSPALPRGLESDHIFGTVHLSSELTALRATLSSDDIFDQTVQRALSELAEEILRTGREGEWAATQVTMRFLREWKREDAHLGKFPFD